MARKTMMTLALIFAFVTAGVSSLFPIARIEAAGAETVPQKYQGTITLQRTLNTAEAKVNESVTYKNFILISSGQKANLYHFMNQDDISVTTSADMQDSSTTVRCPARTVKDSEVGITLAMDTAKRKYTIIAGPVENIPAGITTAEGKFADFYGIMGQTAADIPLPAVYDKLTGSKTISETSGAKVVLEWDLKAY